MPVEFVALIMEVGFDPWPLRFTELADDVFLAASFRDVLLRQQRLLQLGTVVWMSQRPQDRMFR